MACWVTSPIMLLCWTSSIMTLHMPNYCSGCILMTLRMRYMCNMCALQMNMYILAD